MSMIDRPKPPPPMVGDYILLHEYMCPEISSFSTVCVLCWSEGYNLYQDGMFVVRDSRGHVTTIVRYPGLDTHMHRGWRSILQFLNQEKLADFFKKEKETQDD